MVSGWQYRVAGAGGTVIGTVVLVAILNEPSIMRALRVLPLLGQWPVEVASGKEFLMEAAIATLAFTVACSPLFKPRPRRILDTITLTQERVLIGVFTLATIGYFDYTYRLPRLTLIGLGALMLIAMPVWFVLIRRPVGDGTWLLVGDNPEQMVEIAAAANHELVGYVSPSVIPELGEKISIRGDGGALIQGKKNPSDSDIDLTRLGGLANLKDVLVEYDVDTALLAFSEADRGEFFGALDSCYEHGVSAKVHRDYADSVLVAGESVGPLVDVEIEPWDIQDYVVKRGFDILFSGFALLVLLPVILIIILAIKLEGEGPVFFSQERTFLFGETFTVRKFRTLKPDPSGLVGTTIDGDRHTHLGQFLRTTHLDEIPQLWSILTGKMSVVGPRPAQTALEDDFEAEAAQWRQRWFVKPGLTGLAQINDANSQNPQEKVKYDLRYIRNQSFWFDLKIVVRQLWKVMDDMVSLFSDNSGPDADE